MSQRVNGSQGTMLQGISQQPNRYRLPGQVNDAQNMTSDVVQMLHRRAPSILQGVLNIPQFDPDTSFIHFVQTEDSSENDFAYVLNQAALSYYRVESDGTVTELQITGPDADQYLTTAGTIPSVHYRAKTIGAYTFIVNSNVVLEMNSTTSGPILVENAVEITQGFYSTDYTLTIKIGATTYNPTFTTPDGIYSTADLEDANDAARDITVNEIAKELKIALDGVSMPDTVVYRTGNWIRIRYNGTEDFSVDVSASPGMKVFDLRNIPNTASLPAKSRNGIRARVVNGSDSADDVYFEFESAGLLNAANTGTWVEGLGPDVRYQPLARTWPAMIKYDPGQPGHDHIAVGGETSGGATFPAWTEKTVGDNNTNPDPAIIGSKIQDVAVFQDRLVLITPYDIVMSESGNLFNFFRTTTRALLATAPIEMTSNAGSTHFLRYIAFQGKDLIIFSDNTQFQVTGSVAITPENATLIAATDFNMENTTRPVAAGNVVFFDFYNGDYAGIREFYTDSDLNQRNARPLTVHVNRLIEGKVRDMTASSNEEKLAVLAEAENIIYMYEYLWENNERIQASWIPWVFPENYHIVKVAFSNTALNIIAEVGSQVVFLTLDISDTQDNDVIGYADAREAITVANTTGTVTLDSLTTDNAVAIQSTGCPYPGMQAAITDITGNTVTFDLDMEGGTVLIGNKFESYVEPSMPIVRDADGNEIGTAELVVGKMYINYEETAMFDVDVTSRSPHTSRFSGRLVGGESATVGERELLTGTFPVAVRDKSDNAQIRIRTDSPFPMRILDVEWDGKFNNRGTRITRS